MIDHLKRIALHYKKEYNLNTFIDICKEGEDCYFKALSNVIFICLDYVKKCFKEGKLNNRGIIFKNNYEVYIYALLHELYHSIDYKNNPKRFKNEVDQMNVIEYQENGKYHISQPFEKRADEFARQELIKWI